MNDIATTRITEHGVSVNGDMLTWQDLRAALGTLGEDQSDEHTADEFFGVISLIEVIEDEWKDKTSGASDLGSDTLTGRS